MIPDWLTVDVTIISFGVLTIAGWIALGAWL
jgi:hypothetical protein